MGKYSEYKTINLPWLAKIPANWELIRNKQFLREKKDIVGDLSNQFTLLSLTLRGVIKRDLSEKKGKLPGSFDTYKIISPGDIIFCLFDMDETPRTVGLSEYDGMLTGAYTVFQVNGINPQFLYYYYLSLDNIKALRPLYTGLRKTIKTDTFLALKLPVPPRAEQDQIVRFLDWKVSEINKLIGIRRKEIQELNQAKESIITRAVTHGIKKRVKYKTNDKYYKELPIGWHITKTRHVLLQPLTDGPHTTPTFFEDGIPFVSAEAVSCGNGRIDFEHIRGFISQDFYEECCKKYIPQIDDIYMIKSGATTGRVAIVDTDKIFTIWSPLAVFRCNPRVITARFLFYALQANPYQQQVQDGWSYGTQQNIGMRVLERLKIAYPDIVEQNEISSYLDSKCNLFERLIQLTRNKIKGLLELKNTIISDVVTGKIDVRNIPVPDYEHVGDSANDGEGNDEETGIPGEED